jgi:hypothetical protein
MRIRYIWNFQPKLFEDFSFEASAVPRIGDMVKIAGIAKPLKVNYLEWQVELETSLNSRGVVVPQGGDVEQDVTIYLGYPP